MSAFHKLLLDELCINKKHVDLSSEGSINELKVYQERGRKHLELITTPKNSLVLDVQESVSEFSHSNWNIRRDFPMILDIDMILRSLPDWMVSYSTTKLGCIHRVTMTMKIKCIQSQLKEFVAQVSSALTDMQCKCLEKSSDATILWDKRTTILPSKIVTSVKILLSNFEKFSVSDLERLKDDKKWLSDTHITFGLQDCFRDCNSREVWGNLRIKLLDTMVWQNLREEPENFHERYRAKANLLESDFLLMPMFDVRNKHWRLGIIEKPSRFLEGETNFHILDSLPFDNPAVKEVKQLQFILLQYFKEESYKEGRIVVNVAKVPRQKNTNDCGCFTIYFGRKFLNDPDATMALVRTPFTSRQDSAAAWGLKEDGDVTFVRRELKGLLFKYINKGDAAVEYELL